MSTLRSYELSYETRGPWTGQDGIIPRRPGGARAAPWERPVYAGLPTPPARAERLWAALRAARRSATVTSTRSTPSQSWQMR